MRARDVPVGNERDLKINVLRKEDGKAFGGLLGQRAREPKYLFVKLRDTQNTTKFPVALFALFGISLVANYLGRSPQPFVYRTISS